jgi:hypothetical protein
MSPIPVTTTILAVVSEAPGEIDVRTMARLCQRIAMVYLSGKISSGNLDPARFGLNLNDLATDSIADLFRRDDQGQFPAFKRYFSRLCGRLVTDAEYLSALRRLLFSHVNQHLFRLHREFDPSLGKIIRNIKLAAKHLRHFHLDEVLGEPWIVDKEDFRDDRECTLMPPEILERQLAPALSGNGTMIHALEEFRTILLDSPSYRKAYPLVGLGIILRRVMSQLAEADKVTDTRLDPGLGVDEIRAAVAASVKRVEQRMRETYLSSEKVSPKDYTGYFAAIRNLFNERYAGENGIDLSYFDYLNQTIGPMPREEYRTCHRVRFEYLAKLTRQEFVRIMEKEL